MSTEIKPSAPDADVPSAAATAMLQEASRSTAATMHDAATAAQAEELTFEATQRITLRCGKSSITLHPNGKIVLKGEYILSDAEGINRIAGGHIELN